jgi:hypothetical protein
MGLGLIGEAMASDREKILAEIERRIEDSNNIGFVEGECGYRTGLRDIRDFIAKLPAAEESQYWAVYIPGYDPSLFCIEGAARACAVGLSGEVHRVSICRLEDK